MMRHYAIIDSQGRRIGDAPDHEIEIVCASLRADGIVAYPDLAYYEDLINAEAEAKRKRYVPAPGQALTYQIKEQQARAFAAGGYQPPVPPLVQAEVDAGIAPDARNAADTIIAAADRARAALAAIERERRRAIAAIRAAADHNGVQAALEAGLAAIRAI